MKDEMDSDVLRKTDDLNKFIQQNKGVDFLTFDLQQEDSINKLNFKNFKKKQPEIILKAKAYQRLLRIVPHKDHDICLLLMQQGLHSALQIASMTRNDFLSRCSSILDKKQADIIYQNALTKRSSILMQHMNTLQNNEPHISSARFN